MVPAIDSTLPSSASAVTTSKVCHCDLPVPDCLRPLKATVMSLPPELLVMVFEYLDAPLVEARERNCDVQSATRNTMDNNERVTRGNVFPYPYVDVCRHWTNIILGVPRFWTNAVVFIGPREKVYGNHIGGAETIFSASRTLPFDVTIRSTKLDPKLDPAGWFGDLDLDDLEHEQSDIVRILGLLVPHLHRCRSLSLYTLLLGAMPLVYRHLDGPAPLLKVLTFQTDNITDRDEQPPYGLQMKLPSDVTRVASAFAPPLEKLVVDGISFRDVHKHHARIAETYGAHLVVLALTNYAPDSHFRDPNYQPLCAGAMARALAPLAHLDALKLSHVHFDEEDDAEEEALGPADLNIRALFVEGMDDDSLVQLFSRATFPQLDDLWFKGCWPGYEYDPGVLPTDVPFLTLEGISYAHVTDLAAALCDWDVYAIRACAASAFDDCVLDMLSEPRDPDVASVDATPMTEFGCDALRQLSVLACSSVSIAALKRMVLSRNRWVDYDDPKWRSNAPVGPAIQALILWEQAHQPTLMITPEDEAWFHARVASFQFHSYVDARLEFEDSELYFHADP
ncbi:hypothetical protein HYPSUDRAFT_68732 [Hypholoma sublateritium FD-334 SS-4]|uniref:F-box domain-containing protein n=1 Tax=Hypholoma sublateritium (strain FD-334 SS-4) TaxID=945553 RepID=A0A0D2L0C6_HYPSF|nr:hypothetical protein HYPSUDRAFT_68732 [Hypholoma sublateritium FD-334 SS-4]